MVAYCGWCTRHLGFYGEAVVTRDKGQWRVTPTSSYLEFPLLVHNQIDHGWSWKAIAHRGPSTDGNVLDVITWWYKMADQNNIEACALLYRHMSCSRVHKSMTLVECAKANME